MKRILCSALALSVTGLTGLAATGTGGSAPPSSHREAPLITELPKVDGTDFYMFRSYETGREDFVTIVANYLPLQDPYGGPNYFALDPEAIYEIHIDNDGDAVEDITFAFRFRKLFADIALQIGNEMVPVPLVNVGPIPGMPANVNRREEFQVQVVFGDRRSGMREDVTDMATGAAVFEKPLDNIGTKSIPDYEDYADDFLYDIVLPGGATGRMFVGQRDDPFVVNLGDTFDLVNLDPLGAPDGGRDDLEDKNVTSLILEVPIDFLVDAGAGPVIGGWTTASLRQARVFNPDPAGSKGATIDGGAFVQVSRLGMPLVNEVVIGLPDKDVFNGSEPVDDARFLVYVTNPTLPALLEILFGVQAPDMFPRDDLVEVFLTGLDGLNQPMNVTASEMLRLNTDIAPTAVPDQERLGVLGGDLAGYPNGRRPGDDVVDISLRVVMGVLLDPSVAPDGDLPYTDQALVDATFFDTVFPYLETPLAGSAEN